jgi:hypothetical protein
MITTKTLFGAGEAARRLGCALWQLQRLLADGEVQVARFQRYWALCEEEMPALRAALIRRGYIEPPAGQPAD